MALDLPSGTRCFIDANVLVYALIDTPPFTATVDAFIQRVAKKEIAGFTTSIVFSEALHRVMIAEVLSQFRPTIKPLTYVQRHPQVMAQLSIYPVAVDRLNQIGISLLPFEFDAWRAASAVAARYHLLTNDACIVAAMAIHRIRDLVTNDDDFGHVSGITVWKPR